MILESGLILVWFWNTPSDAKEIILLALHSGIIPSSIHGNT